MRQRKSFNPFTATIGAAFVASAVSLPLNAAAADNPFVANDIGSGYQLASKDAEGKCGEGKCGEGKKDKEGKGGEGKCGEGKCGEGKKEGKEEKGGEGKCGEGKCGG